MSKRITYCQMTLNRLDETIKCIKSVSPYVDRIIVVDGGSTDETIPTLREWKKVELYIHPWVDNYSMQRNYCLQHTGEKGGTDWILFSDSDELIPKETCEHLQEIVSLPGDHNTISLKARKVYYRGSEKVHDAPTKFWKPLLYKYYPENKYEGKLHETLYVGGETKILHSDYEYYHIKQKLTVIIRGARNVFVGGGGMNLGKYSEKWMPFLQTVKDIAGVEYWEGFNKYMLSGNIDPKIKELFYKYKDEDGYDGASEWRDLYITYFRIYHPEEEPKEFRSLVIEP